MHFDFADLSVKEQHKLLTSAVTPRPIAWVVSQDRDGRVNASPFSFFNVCQPDLLQVLRISRQEWEQSHPGH